MWAVAISAACGDSGNGGATVNPVAESRTYDLRCTVDEVLLEMALEVSFELDRPFVAGERSELTAEVTFVFGEPTIAALADAGVTKIDVISMEVVTSVRGATPSTLATSLTDAPINDFDLELDTDQDGVAGPRSLGLGAATAPTTPGEGSAEVELGLLLDGISILLGDFQVPDDCVEPSLVGSSASFPVGSAGPRTTRGGTADTSTTLMLSETWLTTQTSSSFRAATATGSRPTGTDAPFAAKPPETSKISK